MAASSDQPTGGEVPEQGGERLLALLAEMAKSRYERLFPNYPLPDFDALMAWLDQLGVTFSEFAFQGEPVALRVAALGPVGGWRVQDEANPDNPDGRALTPLEIARLVAAVHSSFDAKRPGRRRNKA